jgi:hypothetical protein
MFHFHSVFAVMVFSSALEIFKNSVFLQSSITHVSQFYIAKRFSIKYVSNWGRDMAQAVSRWPLTAESRVRVRVSPCGIYGGQRGTGTSFSPSSSVPLSISFHSILMYHLRDERYVR